MAGIRGKHEPIVDNDTWQAANDIRQKKRRNKYDSLGEPHPLTGLLYCADCKSKMHHNRGTIKSTKKIADAVVDEITGEIISEEVSEVITRQKNHYTCKESKHGVEFCTGHRINGGVVEELVLETLQRVSQYATTNETDFKRQINEMYSTQQADNIKSQRKKLKSSQSRHAELDKLIQRIYEDNFSGKINDKRFEILSNQYEQEQAELEQLIVQLENDLTSYDDSTDRAAKFLELTKRYKQFEELTPTMLHEFVDRIEIHERADRRAVVTTQKVDVYLNFIGTYSPPIDETEQAQEPDPEEVAAHEKRMAKLLYQREYKKRREANGGKPLGHFEGKRPDTMTPEERAEYEAERKLKRQEYNRQYYLNNKAKLDADQAARNAAKLATLTPEENEERKRKRREYESGYRDRNREQINAKTQKYRDRKREQNPQQQNPQQQHHSQEQTAIAI